MDVTELLKQLGVLAEKSPEARAFILALMLQLVLLAAFMMFGVTGLVRRFRNRNDAESDADVTPKDTTINVLTQILAKTIEVLDRIDQKLDRVDKRGEGMEAGIAGISATTTLSSQAGVKALEADDVLINLMDRIDKRVAAIRTRDEATTEKSELATHVTETVRPVLEQVKTNAAAVGALDGKLDQHKALIEGLPAAVVSKSKDELLPIYRDIYNELQTKLDTALREKDIAQGEARAKTEELAQALAARDTFRAQAELLAADNAALNEKLRVAESTIAALPKPEPTTAEGGAA